MASADIARRAGASPPDHRRSPVPADNTASSAPPSAAGIASRSTGADPPDRPRPAARPGSWPRPFAKKISLDCQLADLLVKLGNLRLIHGPWARHPALAAGEQARRPLEQRLFPSLNLPAMNPQPPPQFCPPSF